MSWRSCTFARTFTTPILVAALATALCSCAAPGREFGPRDSEATLLRDWAAFKAARRMRNTETLANLIDDTGFSIQGMKELVSHYVVFLDETDADLRTSDLQISRVEWFEEAPKIIAFIRMQVPREAFDEGRDRSGSSRLVTQVAFSSDRGGHWRFNVQDCIQEGNLRRFTSAYSGAPPLAP